MRVGAYTDKGKVRQVNEDSYYIPGDMDNDIRLFVVADGMGGHNAGDIASKVATEVVTKYILHNFGDCDKDKDNLLSLLKEGIILANQSIYEKSMTDPQVKGMGTTLVVVLIYTGRLYIAHVGDSRVYIIRKAGIFQLTRDHSFVEELVESGQITREQAASHPQKNIITRALGSEGQVDIDVCVRRFYKNDTVILCTDGLTNLISNQEISQKAQTIESPQQLAEQLVGMANEAGGIDNITVVVVRN